MAWPDPFRVLKEVRPPFGPIGEIRPGWHRALFEITGAACSHQITIGTIAPAHPRLHMIQREGLLWKHLPAVDASVAVPPQDAAA